MPSISCGLRPAVVEGVNGVSVEHQAQVSVLPEPREKVLSPTPAIQDWSLSEYIGLLLPGLEAPRGCNGVALRGESRERLG